MSFWTNLRDSVIKPALAVAAAPVTGGASMAVLAADRAAPPGALDFSKKGQPAPVAVAPPPPPKDEANALDSILSSADKWKMPVLVGSLLLLGAALYMKGKK